MKKIKTKLTAQLTLHLFIAVIIANCVATDDISVFKAKVTNLVSKKEYHGRLFIEERTQMNKVVVCLHLLDEDRLTSSGIKIQYLLDGTDQFRGKKLSDKIPILMETKALAFWTDNLSSSNYHHQNGFISYNARKRVTTVYLNFFNEPPYTIDNYLNHLRLSTFLNGETLGNTIPKGLNEHLDLVFKEFERIEQLSGWGSLGNLLLNLIPLIINWVFYAVDQKIRTERVSQLTISVCLIQGFTSMLLLAFSLKNDGSFLPVVSLMAQFLNLFLLVFLMIPENPKKNEKFYFLHSQLLLNIFALFGFFYFITSIIKFGWVIDRGAFTLIFGNVALLLDTIVARCKGVIGKKFSLFWSMLFLLINQMFIISSYFFNENIANYPNGEQFRKKALNIYLWSLTVIIILYFTPSLAFFRSKLQDFIFKEKKEVKKKIDELATVPSSLSSSVDSKESKGNKL